MVFTLERSLHILLQSFSPVQLLLVLDDVESVAEVI